MRRFKDKLSATAQGIVESVRSISPGRGIDCSGEQDPVPVKSGRSSAAASRGPAETTAPNLRATSNGQANQPSLLSSSTNDSSRRPPESRLSADIANGLKAALSALKECVDDVPAPGLKTAVGGILAIIEICENVSGNAEDSKGLISHITDFTDRLKKCSILGLPESSIPELESRIRRLEVSLQLIQDDLSQIRDSNKLRRVANHEAYKSAIVKLNSAFDRITSEFNTEAIIAVEIDAKLAASGVANLRQEVGIGLEKVELAQKDLQLRLSATEIQQLVEKLSRADAQFDSGSRMDVRGCSPQTRTAVLSKVRLWINDTRPDCPPIFWLCGEAGVGKTTVAYTVAEEQAKAGRLGASFFFSRSNESTQRPSIFVPTIAYQMVGFNDGILKEHIAKAVKLRPLISTATVQTQLPVLIGEPLNACVLEPATTMVIVIDALDECGSLDLARTIIRAWAAEVGSVRLRLRVLITSRPDAHIRAQISRTKSLTERFEFHDVADYIVMDEIRHYLRTELQQVAANHGLTTVPWPDTTGGTLFFT